MCGLQQRNCDSLEEGAEHMRVHYSHIRSFYRVTIIDNVKKYKYLPSFYINSFMGLFCNSYAKK